MKPLACFTIARNESFFLPLWLKHYAATGGHLYVLDHESNDGSTSTITGGKVSVIRVVRQHTDDVGWMLNMVERQQRELLEVYERVVFAEVDEFLIPDPDKYTDLGEYLARVGGDSITATAYDVCESVGQDPVGVPPILAQRSWKRNDQYDKTLISSHPICWQVGFHRPFAGFPRPEPDPTLLLVHLHYADREIAWERLVSRMAGREPAPGDWGRQNKVRDRVVFDRDFDEAVSGPLESIPERYRSLL